MDRPRKDRARLSFLSLRWQALIALSLVLMVVNGVLAWMAYRHSSAQFDLQQAGVRENQVRQLRGLLVRNYEEMTRLVSVVPLLGSDPAANPAVDFGARLRHGLESDGALLGLEWDVRSVYWITGAGQPALVWPVDAEPPGGDLLARLTGKDDSVNQVLACQPECLQFLAAPVLWRGRSAGTLVLGRSLADALLAFNALTAAEVAVFTTTGPPRDGDAAPVRFPAMTHPSRTAPIIHAVAPDLAGGASGGERVLGELGGQWFEVFRVENLAPGVAALVVNEVTAERQSIRAATRISALLGLGGLILSGSLLFWLAESSVGRLRRIVAALPLLADNRYEELRSSLPPVGGRLTPADELDHLSETAQALTDRMEQLQHDREEVESRLVWLADHDPLTRLYNRRRFHKGFARVIDQAQRFGHRGALLFLDLDQFKDVNDLSGHQVGDLMLQRVAEQLSMLIHPSDILARLGGDEFALVLPECSEAQALACAERIQAVVGAIVVRERGRVHRVTASIGIALFPDQGQEPQEVLANADLAMFQAKDKGRGRWNLFSTEDRAREQADARVTWRDKIAEGLRDERFELHFQPVVVVATGVVDHWEALLRLRDGHGELVYPDRFIPVAEKTGQIQAIDHWVLTQSVQVLARDARLRLAINLSGGAMSDPSLLPDLERLLAKHRVSPTRLTFEVTETVAVASLVRATELMQAIQQLGCRFALDDFGSGYASYAYLRQLPVDDVKIDGAFIRNLATNREDRIFVKAITDMAHGMGKLVTAEFVESAAIYEVLGELGVDCAQGYLFGRPTPIADHGPWPRVAGRPAAGERAEGPGDE